MMFIRRPNLDKMMKTTIMNPYEGGRTAVLAFLATSAFAVATPEMAPSGNQEISEFIAMDVASDSRMEGSDVSVKINGGIAILTGRVKTLDQSERAVERAMAASGVRAVVNRIKIASSVVSDSALKSSALAALKKSRAVDAANLRVSALEGVVTLDGEVSTWDEQEIVREVVSGVPGVTGIENRTEVVFSSPRTDRQIEAQLAGLIANDPLYDGLHLSVSVKEGMVRLKGEVGTKGEYDRLVRRSSVTGVFEVNADQLKVNGDLAMEAVEDKHFTPEQMTGALADAVKADDRIDARMVSFSLAEGVVTIEGTVIRKEEKFAAESTARGVPGVMAVNNKLRISEARPEVAANAPLVTPR